MAENKKPNGIKISPWWISGIIIAMFVVLNIVSGTTAQDPSLVSTSKLDALIDNGQVDKIITYNNKLAEIYLTKEALKLKENKKIAKDVFGNPNKGPHYTTKIPSAENFEKKLIQANKDKKIKSYDFQEKSDWSEILIGFLPFIVLIGIWIYIMRRMSGGAGGGPGGQIFNIGKSRAKLFDEKAEVKITFKDVAGLEGAKEEVQEIVEFLKNPEKYTALGAKIPKGALLVGPPGTGKTLLAKAVAGEAKVPFFSLSGSDFVEMFVGVGASRVRDLFKQAKDKSPAIIFIDEIDAVGRARGKNTDRKSTL